MNPELFVSDLEAKPHRMRLLAAELATAWAEVPRAPQLLLLGMGSSHYANQVAAARLRASGVWAVAEIASHDLLPTLAPSALVIAVSASGGSVETLDAVRRLRGSGVPATFVALTNRDGTELSALCDLTVPMLAGEERGGVACRSFQHTLALLLSLPGAGLDPHAVLRAAEATEELLLRRDEWLVPVSEVLLGPAGTHIAAPARRFSSAQQSALMLREGPRLASVGCETGDWSHVDVYLTKNTDYRLLLLRGSRWEPELLRWTAERGTPMVGVGADLPDARFNIRFPHDDDDDVRLLTETLVVELVAGAAWVAQQ